LGPEPWSRENIDTELSKWEYAVRTTEVLSECIKS